MGAEGRGDGVDGELPSPAMNEPTAPDSTSGPSASSPLSDPSQARPTDQRGNVPVDPVSAAATSEASSALPPQPVQGWASDAPPRSSLPPPPRAPGPVPEGWAAFQQPVAIWQPPAPPPKEPPTSADVARAIRLLLVAVVVGLVVDVGLRGGPIGLGSAVAIGGVATGLMALVPDRSAEHWLWGGLAVLASAGLVLWTSPWVVTLDWLAAIAFLGLASSVRGDRPTVGSSMPWLAWRSGGPATVGFLWSPVEMLGAVDTIRRRPAGDSGTTSALRGTAPAVLRGLGIAIPVVLLLGTLLASADGVFASFFDLPSFDLADAMSHLFLIGIGAAGLIALNSSTPEPTYSDETSSRPLGPVETMVVLGGIVVLYGLFAIAQVMASSGGDERIQATTGLTYAEYARTGFFQLLWCAAITMAILLGLRAMARPGGGRQQRVVRIISASTCALTLVVVATAIVRLGLYQDAYGLTMLRLACTTFAWMLGVAFGLLGVRMLQTRSRDWLPASYLLVAVVTLGWWNVSQPEARVVRYNLDRAATTGKLDIDYLDTMSDDALPAILGGLDRLPAPLAEGLRQRLCRPLPPPVDMVNEFGESVSPPRTHAVVAEDGTVATREGWVGFNRSRSAAVDALRECADSLQG